MRRQTREKNAQHKSGIKDVGKLQRWLEADLETRNWEEENAVTETQETQVTNSSPKETDYVQQEDFLTWEKRFPLKHFTRGSKGGHPVKVGKIGPTEGYH